MTSRQEAIAWVIVIGGALLASNLMAITLSGSVILDAVLLTIVAAPPLVGALTWRRAREPWFVIGTWTIPLLGWMTLVVLGPVPSWISGIGAAAGVLVGIVLVFVEEARESWHRLVADG